MVTATKDGKGWKRRGVSGTLHLTQRTNFHLAHVDGQTEAVLSDVVPTDPIVDPDGGLLHPVRQEPNLGGFVHLSFPCAILRSE